MRKSIYIKINNKEIESSFYNDTYITLIINNDIKIAFLTLPYNLKELALGYLFNITMDKIKNIEIKENEVIINIDLPRDEILHRLEIKNIINTCDQITLNNKNIKDNYITMPFNSSRSSISSANLKQYEKFLNNDEIYQVTILVKNDSLESTIQHSDTNTKNTIYKAIGDSRLNMLESLYNCVILLNFKIDMEILKILILQKITFIVCVGNPSFSIIKYAQKFGITLIAFDKSLFKILTHSSRISD